MTDNEILDLAASAGITAVCCNHGGTYRDGVDTLKLFAEKAIEKFLKDSGQYVTNDASRQTAIAQAVAAEREACAQVCEAYALRTRGYLDDDMTAVKNANAIRARGAK